MNRRERTVRRAVDVSDKFFSDVPTTNIKKEENCHKAETDDGLVRINFPIARNSGDATPDRFQFVKRVLWEGERSTARAREGEEIR